ncbi:MAG: exodeoxyribonuclease V subunit gamma [Candidatus Azambacteria bacterium]|nr:exodeoxyribonuclease V subunit gamma [Candidatus Azambacteria bacterium]
MEDFCTNLNERQREAVMTEHGPLLVIAGAGSGKTTVLTRRIASLISKGVARPDQVLAVTFTNKAAGEMKERVRELLAKTGTHTIPLIGTFHSVCLTMLRTYAELLGYGRDFIIFDSKDQKSLLKSVCEELRIDTERFTPDSFSNTISSLKSKLITPDAFTEDAHDPYQKMAAKVYEKYQDALKEHNAVDFDDMIMLCVNLFEARKDILELYQEQFQYILIDEYQDTNFAQHRFVNLLASRYRNICAVGDLDQAIYGWRQADVANILNFETQYPDAKVVVLEENYRSTQNILSAANTIISKNKMRTEKNLFTKNKVGEKISVVVAATETQEAEFVARMVRTLTREKNFSLSDIAVLYRTNAQSRAIEEMFARRSVAYKVIGGLKFYERKEIKDVLAYLRLVANPRDTVSLKRIINFPPRGIGKVSLTNFFQKKETTKSITGFFELIESLKEARATLPLSAFMKLVIKQSGIEAHLKECGEKEETRWENVRELISAAASYDAETPEQALTSFLDNAALASQESKGDDKGAVHVMTMHSAKGLEFRAVFVIGMEDNIFPHSRSKQSPAEMEEERRLCYVAVTRAKEHVWLLYARARRTYGQTQMNPPSRFLFDIPEHLVSFSVCGEEASISYDDLENGIVGFETY